jgi:hypothetical protein
MANKRELKIEILGDAKGVAGAFNEAERKADGFNTKIVGVGKTAGLALAGVGVAAVGAAGVIGVKAVGAASDLNESINAVQVTFGDASGGILQLSEDAARAVGLSKEEFNGLAVQFSNFADTVGKGTGKGVVRTMDDLTTRAADFASVMNLDVADAAALFQSGLAGESEPLRKFGIDLSAAAVEAHAYATGIAAAGEPLTEQQKVQARYSLLMDQTSKTQGDFANTSDSLANRQRILKAEFANMSAEIGTALMPAISAVAGFITDKLVPWMRDHLPGAIAATKRAFQGVADWVRENWPTIRETILGAVTKVREGIDGFITFVREAWKDWGDEIMAVVEIAFPFIRDSIKNTIEVIRGIIKTVTSLITLDWSGAWDGIKQIFSGVWDQIRNIVGAQIAALKLLLSGAWAGIKSAVSSAWTGIKDAVGSAITGIIDLVTGMPGKFIELVSKFAGAGKNLASAIVSGIGDGLGDLLGKATSVAKQFANGIIRFINTNIIDKVNDLFEFEVGLPFGAKFKVDPPDISRIPTFHAGGVADFGSRREGLALLRNDEVILTPEQARAMGSGGPTVIVNNYGTSVNAQEIGHEIGWQWRIRGSAA